MHDAAMASFSSRPTIRQNEVPRDGSGKTYLTFGYQKKKTLDRNTLLESKGPGLLIACFAICPCCPLQETPLHVTRCGPIDERAIDRNQMTCPCIDLTAVSCIC
jgi:hypothetical protein